MAAAPSLSDFTRYLNGGNLTSGRFLLDARSSVHQTTGTAKYSRITIGGTDSGSQYLLSGGAVELASSLQIGYEGEGKMTVSNTGILNVGGNVYIGYHVDKSGNSSFQIDGGSVTGKVLFLSNQWENASSADPSGISSMTMTGGSATFTGMYLGYGNNAGTLGGNGLVKIEGGTLTMTGTVVGQRSGKPPSYGRNVEWSECGFSYRVSQWIEKNDD